MLPTKYDAKSITREINKVDIKAAEVYQLRDTTIDLRLDIDGNSAAITQEALVRITDDEALAQLLTNLNTEFDENVAAVNVELIALSNADSATAATITTLSATVDDNASNIVQEALARTTADESITLISDTQRALFGAAVSDNWDANVTYTGSTAVVNGNTVGTGDDVVYGGFVYRCKVTHSNQVPPNTLYWDRVDTVDANVTAAVLAESTARASADLALAQTSTAISGRVSTLENDTTDADAIAVNAADIITNNSLIVTNDASYAERFELTAARFGVTVADTYDNTRTYQVGEEAIYSTILYRCTSISLGNLPTDTLFWAFQSLVPADISAAVQAESTARATAIGALASDITAVTATADGNTAQIVIEATASAAADSLLQIDVDGAIAAAAASQATADGKIDSFYQTTAPTVAGEGDIWFDTDDGNTIYTYQSGVWTLSADSDIALAILDASTAQATADGKVTSFYTATAPTAEGIGDFWIDIDDGNKLYRWNGSTWVDVRDIGISSAIADAAAAQAAADGKIETFFTSTAPAASGVGDLWFDTNDGNTIYRWSGSAWELSADSDIAQAILDAAGAQSTADGKVATFYQNEPPTAEGSGDLWVDTNDGNKLYRWNLSNWVLVQDTAIPALEARYGVTLDVNDYITGFSQNNDGTTGTFKILADVFKIIDPAAGAGQAGLDAFTYSGGVVSLGTGVKLTADSIDAGTMSADRIQFDGQYLEVVNGFLKVKGAPGTQGPIVVCTATGATEPSATVTRVANGTVNCTLSYSLSKNASQNDYSATTPFPITITLKRAGTVIKTWIIDGIWIDGVPAAGEPYVVFGSLDVAFVDGDTGSGSTEYTMGLGSVNLLDFDVETQITASASL